VERYGADALRMGIVWGALVENDISLSEDNIRGQRNFANKIWNVARFISDFTTGRTYAGHRASPKVKSDEDEWIKKELRETTKRVTKALDNYHLNEAVEELYEFVWHKFADIYIEKVKHRNIEARPILEEVLKTSLKLLHPFMPFVTEAIWEELGEKEMLIISPWPKS